MQFYAWMVVPFLWQNNKLLREINAVKSVFWSNYFEGAFIVMSLAR